ncbi:uncharacterized protein LOC136020218 isoform X2 [Lathamus discolor]|uniref:uncharacterized protein LOC136020218 isoform X2 n=1 Tax=Lathamus discolor TaxID=678569 RepID=UPI0032B84D8A
MSAPDPGPDSVLRAFLQPNADRILQSCSHSLVWGGRDLKAHPVSAPRCPVAMGTMLPPSQSRGDRCGFAHCEGAPTVSVGYLRSESPAVTSAEETPAAFPVAALRILALKRKLLCAWCSPVPQEKQEGAGAKELPHPAAELSGGVACEEKRSKCQGPLKTQSLHTPEHVWPVVGTHTIGVLSHNPLSVIEDTWFFKLPSVTHLDLGATRVTRQTLLMLLLRTSRLETLKLSIDTACCLCQHKHSTETPCRTLSFDCMSVCGSTAPRCAPLAETPGLLTGLVPPRKGNSSSMLNLQPKEPSHREQRTVTLAVFLSSPDASAPSSKQLSRQEVNTAKELTLMLQSIQHRGWSSSVDTRRFYFLAEGLVAQLKNKLHKAMSILTVKSPSTAWPAQRDKGQEVAVGEGGRAISWQQQEPGSGLNRAESILWEAVPRMNISDILPVSSHQRTPTLPAAQPPTQYPTEAPRLAWSGESQDHSDAMEQTNMTDRMENEEAPSPTQDSAGTDEEQKQQDSDGTMGSDGAEEEPTTSEGRAEQRLSTIQHFFYALLAKNVPPAASSTAEGTAAAERSSRGGSQPTAPASTTTHGKHKEQEPLIPTASSTSSGPGGAATRGAPFDTLLRRHLHSLVPDRALRRFMASVARALRKDCGLPQLQQACAKMVSRTGLLLKLLSERQRDREHSDLLELCVREEDAGTSHPHAQVQAREMESESAETEMASHTSDQWLPQALSLLALVTLTSVALLVQCCFKGCAKKHDEDCKGSSRWCFWKLWPKWWRWSKDTGRDKDEEVALSQLDVQEESELDEVVFDLSNARTWSSFPSAGVSSEGNRLLLAPQAP